MQELAFLAKGTASTLGLAWEWTFKTYFVSQICLVWSNSLYKLWKDNPAANSSNKGQYEHLFLDEQ